MTFNDDDLKQLKKEIKGQRWCEANLRTHNLKALLARLEAAELSCVALEDYIQYIDMSPLFSESDGRDQSKAIKVLKKWKKAAGKE